jgi:hypothetical protein
LCDAFKDEKDQKRLAGLLQKGGLSNHPAVFGQLLKAGCAGDLEEPDELTMEHRAAQMQRLAAAYNQAADQKNLKGLLDKGGLGAPHGPAMLAHVLRTGCDGDPAKLKQLGASFAKDEDLAKLNALVMQGGLGGKPAGPGGVPAADRPDTLGKVLGQGLRKKGTPTKGEPDRLKELYEAFKGDGGADLTKLKSLMDAFNDDKEEVFKKTPPPPRVEARVEPEPGLRLATLLDEKNLGSKLSKLKDLHDSLKAQTQQVGSEGVGADAVQRRASTLPELIRHAATMAKVQLSGAQPAGLGLGDCAHVKAADMSHFCDRHTREHTQFAELASKNTVIAELNSPDVDTRKRGKRKAKITTFWPEGITDVEIAQYVGLALTELGPNVPSNASFMAGAAAPVGGARKGNFIQFNNVAIASSPLFTVTIGFEWLGANNIKITQFYPVGGPGLGAVVFFDLHAIKSGIKS